MQGSQIANNIQYSLVIFCEICFTQTFMNS